MLAELDIDEILYEKVKKAKTINYLFYLLNNQGLTDYIRTLTDEELLTTYRYIVGADDVKVEYIALVDVIKQEMEYRKSEKYLSLKNNEDKYKGNQKLQDLIKEQKKEDAVDYLETISNGENKEEKVDCTVLLRKFPTIANIDAFSIVYGALISSGMSEDEFTNCMMDESLAKQMYLSAKDRSGELPSYLLRDEFINYLRSTSAKFIKEEQTNKQANI
jgi:hypothetical protein